MATAIKKNKVIEKETTNKPSKRGGIQNFKGRNGIKPFSKDNQPTGEAKRNGKLVKKKGVELAKAILELAFKGSTKEPLKKKVADYYGIEVKDITVEMMLHFRQAEKAIQKQDTHAYVAVMNRAFGLPKSTAEISGPGGKGLFENKTDDELKQLLQDTLSKLNT